MHMTGRMGGILGGGCLWEGQHRQHCRGSRGHRENGLSLLLFDMNDDPQAIQSLVNFLGASSHAPPQVDCR